MAILGVPTALTINAGTLPVKSTSVSVSVPGATVNTPAVVHLSGAIPSGKSADELEMDPLYIWAECGTNQCTVWVRGREGYIYGNFNVVLCVG